MTTPGHVPFRIEQFSHDDLPVLRLTGEFDLRAAPELREALLGLLAPGGGAPGGDDAGAEGSSADRPGPAGVSPPVVLLEMSGLEFLDSTIISVLLMARHRAVAAGGSLRLTGVTPQVARVLDVTGIDGVLDRYASLDEAARGTTGAE